ncbi:outer membrane protein assembly factor BamE [Brackiella oedipodis]|uniref:outer membrane protein assembly factor BamE n=1 Tax=Brackiella oedipodis TaxID=124225 RepID=UPI0009FCA412
MNTVVRSRALSQWRRYLRPTLKASFLACTVSLSTLTLSACSSGKWGFPYRASLQQGNWVTQEQVDLLQKGMTQEQVRFALGSPTLVDVFHPDRWDYPYYFKPGYGDPIQRNFSVWFVDGVVDHWGGDPLPNFQPADFEEQQASGADLAEIEQKRIQGIHEQEARNPEATQPKPAVDAATKAQQQAQTKAELESRSFDVPQSLQEFHPLSQEENAQLQAEQIQEADRQARAKPRLPRGVQINAPNSTNLNNLYQQKPVPSAPGSRPNSLP